MKSSANENGVTISLDLAIVGAIYLDRNINPLEFQAN